MRKISTLLFVIFLLSGCLLTKVSSINEDTGNHLKEKEGYVLLTFDTNINLNSVTINGPKRIQVTSENLTSGRNYLLLTLPVGQYELQDIVLDNFGTKLSDFPNSQWSFDIKESVVNYVGDIHIRDKSIFQSLRYLLLITEGYGYQLDTAIVNNSSMALEHLRHFYPNTMKTRDLVYSGPGEDDFLSWINTLLAKKGEEK